MRTLGTAWERGLKFTGVEAQSLTIGSELQTFVLGHAFPIRSINIAIDVRAPGASDGKGLSYHHIPLWEQCTPALLLEGPSLQ